MVLTLLELSSLLWAVVAIAANLMLMLRRLVTTLVRSLLRFPHLLARALRKSKFPIVPPMFIPRILWLMTVRALVFSVVSLVVEEVAEVVVESVELL